jgi:hypothetical protein
LFNKIYLNNISDSESKRIENIIKKATAEGKSEYEIMDEITGFTITNNKEIGNALRSTLLQSAGDTGLAGFDMGGLARLVNNGQIGAAIRKVEAAVATNQKDTDLKDRDTAARYAVQMGDNLLLKFKANLDKLGIVQGNWNQQKKKFYADPAFQDLQSTSRALVTEWRKAIAGSAISANEQAFIDELIPSVKDNPFNAMQKILSFQKMNLDSLNARRGLYGLPSVDKKSQLNDDNKAPLYTWEDYVDESPKASTAEEMYVDPVLIKKFPWSSDRKKFIMEKLGGFKSEEQTSLKGTIQNISIGNKPITVSSTIADKLARADEEFFKDTGKHIQINQSYRTNAQQAELYKRLSAKGARVAPPGKSFHEKGLAVDVTNWQEAQKYLNKYGLVNPMSDDKGHFSYGEFS